MVKLCKEKVRDIAPTRAYRDETIALARKDPRIVNVEADLGNCIFGGDFQREFPDRYIDIGICEQSLSSIAAGMSAVGMIPFAHSFAVFASRRMCDQNYISCAYAQNNVKIVASAPGISPGENGGTHHAMEDIALVRPMVGVVIMEPADSTAMKWAVRNAAENFGVYYIRAERTTNNKLYEDGSEFALGKANILKDGSDVTLIAEGAVMIDNCFKAAELLEKEGISARIVDIFTIKPLDADTIEMCARETGAIVTAENHSVTGGLGSAVAEVLCDRACQVPFRRIGIQNRFGEVGQVDELLKVMHMTPEDIAEAAKAAFAAKK